MEVCIMKKLLFILPLFILTFGCDQKKPRCPRCEVIKVAAEAKSN